MKQLQQLKKDHSPFCLASLQREANADLILYGIVTIETNTIFLMQVLARDRLLGSYKVKPVIKLLKQTLVGTGTLLVTAVLPFIFATPVVDLFQTTFATKESPSNDPDSNNNVKYSVRKKELLRLPVDVIADDDLAAAAAKATDGRPDYCRDIYYRALAGGQ